MIWAIGDLGDQLDINICFLGCDKDGGIFPFDVERGILLLQLDGNVTVVSLPIFREGRKYISVRKVW